MADCSRPLGGTSSRCEPDAMSPRGPVAKAHTSRSHSASSSDHLPVEFPSEGATLRGRLYLPSRGPPRPPVVVMAHGFSATISGMVADAYAEVFRAAGLAVLLYDHRNLGVSGGEPRQEINPWVQVRGYRSALDFLGQRSDVDPARMAVWGDSLSGREAIIVGSVDARVRAVVAQVPACGDQPPPPDPERSLYAELLDRLNHGDVATDPNHRVGPMPVVSPDQVQSPSLLTPLTAFRWFIEYGGRFGTGWVNRATVGGPVSSVPLHAALFSPRLEAPLLAMIGTNDEMPGANDKIARLTCERSRGHREIVSLDGGHFGLLHFPGPLFDQASSTQRDFLLDHLG